MFILFLFSFLSSCLILNFILIFRYVCSCIVLINCASRIYDVVLLIVRYSTLSFFSLFYFCLNPGPSPLHFAHVRTTPLACRTQSPCLLNILPTSLLSFSPYTNHLHEHCTSPFPCMTAPSHAWPQPPHLRDWITSNKTMPPLACLFQTPYPLAAGLYANLPCYSNSPSTIKENHASYLPRSPFP